jgi:hypothetical protein
MLSRLFKKNELRPKLPYNRDEKYGVYTVGRKCEKILEIFGVEKYKYYLVINL